MELLPNLFKSEYGKIVAVLIKQFGLQSVETAEDLASETFLIASETWGLKGLPENPTGWLYTVAKNKTKDYLKRHRIFTEKVSADIRQGSAGIEEIDLSLENIQDSQLRAMFAVCDPSIPPESQVGLALRLLCGFGIEQIAEAFGTNKESINKRLLRAKEKLRAANFDLLQPLDKPNIRKRMDAVLSTVYLLFNEGYNSSTENAILQQDLCMEAIRLTLLLISEPVTDTPEANALLALMCFHASRFQARINAFGDALLYEEQDKMDWNKELIEKGEVYLTRSASGKNVSKYHLEAAIAYWHTRLENDKEKWQEILQLYNQLLQIIYNPFIALNRTFALSKVKGNKIAIEEAEKLKLINNHFYWCLLGYLYGEENKITAIGNYEKALSLAGRSGTRQLIEFRIGQLKEKNL